MDNPSPPTEVTPLVSITAVNGANESSTEIDVEDGNDYDNFVDIPVSELNRPWPATFERSISLLAGPISDTDFIEEMTKSPKITPNIGARRRVRRCSFAYLLFKNRILSAFAWCHAHQPHMLFLTKPSHCASP